MLLCMHFSSLMMVFSLSMLNFLAQLWSIYQHKPSISVIGQAVLHVCTYTAVCFDDYDNTV